VSRPGLNRGLSIVGLAAGVALLMLLAWHAPAAADYFGDVDCEQFPDHPACQVAAGEQSGPGETVATPEGEMICRLDGQVVPCVTEDGWLGDDGCRYLQVDAPPPPRVEEPGASYRPSCPGDPAGSQRPLVWLPDSGAPGPPALGRLAVARLVLPQPAVELSPPVGTPQLVMLPTWLWIEPAWWVGRSASASVPGVTVTAVAMPVQVRWKIGDGAEYVCDQGTPYPAGGNPDGASPDCGHTFTRLSRDQPGGVFPLSATVTWQVSWSGGGAFGTLGPLFSTATLPVQVLESRSVNTGGQP